MLLRLFLMTEVITSITTGGGLNIDSKLHHSRDKIRYVFISHKKKCMRIVSEEIYKVNLIPTK